MKLEGDKTIVSAMGDVLYAPDNPQGLVVVNVGKISVLNISEVSDDRFTNFFMDVARNAYLINNNSSSPDSNAVTQFEIMAHHNELSEEFIPAWSQSS